MFSDHYNLWGRRVSAAALAGLILCLAAPMAHAWNGTGHMTVADIAYDNLTPKTKAAVNALLERQKDYAVWMSVKPADYHDSARYAFERAATWPDDIRGTSDSHPSWHYIDVPVIAPGYAPDLAAIQPETPNAQTQIIAETKLMTDPHATDGDRAIALCWVEHLAGDISQPLHDASYFSPLFPHGDRGGNSEQLNPDALNGSPIEMHAGPHNLHATWDDALGDTRDPAQIDKIRAQLEKPAYARRTFPQLKQHKTVQSWILEGNAIAKKVAYDDGKLAMTPDGDRAHVTLPAGYLAKEHSVAERQIVVAAYRLADLLNAQKFPPMTAPPVTTIPAGAAEQIGR
jgi:hypothetical protein